MPRLRRSDPADPGLLRRRNGRGFVYLDAVGVRVTDPEALERIRALAIPPAWTDVWICPHPMGHLQAVGTDAAGRRQYLYHSRWRERRDQEKYDRVVRFARALPRLRTVVARDIRAAGMPRARVLACAVQLIDRGYFRIGSEAYAEEHGTVGVATLHKEHARVDRGTVVFDYPAKGDKRLVQQVADPDVADVVRTLKRRRGPGDDELLGYRRGRSWVDVRSDDVNQYIKDAAGDDHSAKDFRTWHGTVLAAVALAVSAPASRSPTARKRAVCWAVAETARSLGNTPAVCRASYIDPRVFDRYRAGVTIGGVIDAVGAEPFAEPELQARVEAAVLDLLAGDSGSEALERVA
jgi:DNA topoisomerase-1